MIEVQASYHVVAGSLVITDFSASFSWVKSQLRVRDPLARLPQ